VCLRCSKLRSTCGGYGAEEYGEIPAASRHLKVPDLHPYSPAQDPVNLELQMHHPTYLSSLNQPVTPALGKFSSSNYLLDRQTSSTQESWPSWLPTEFPSTSSPKDSQDVNLNALFARLRILSQLQIPYSPKPSKRDSYGTRLTSHQEPWQVSHKPEFPNNNHHWIRQVPRYLGAQSVLCFGSSSDPHYCILAPTSEAVVHRFCAWLAAPNDQSGTNHLSMRFSPDFRYYPRVSALPHLESQNEQLASHEYGHDDQEEMVIQTLEKFDRNLSFCENRGVLSYAQQSRTNASLTLHFRFGDLFVAFLNQSEGFWGDTFIVGKVQCPGLNQSEQSDRSNQMEEEAEILGDTTEAITPFIKNTPNSQSDSDCSIFEDETDWEEDNDITNVELTPRLSLSDALTGMARRLEELLLRRLLADHKQMLVNRLMGNFWEFIAMNITMHTQTSGSGSTSNSSPPTGRTAATTPKGKLKGRSRADIDDENPEDEDTRGFKRPKLTNSSPGSMTVSMLFACPYRKHDPRKYNIHDWSTCALTPHRSVARVKYADFHNDPNPN
jgi:hypothetical protein